MDGNPLEGMLSEEMPLPEGGPPAEGPNPELEVAFADFDDAEMPLQVRAEALRMIVEMA